MNIYLASSWRNERQPEWVNRFRDWGYEVYDFRHPTADDQGFHWSQIDPTWRTWTPEQYIEALNHPLAGVGFFRDFTAMKACDVFVGLLPFGRSASFEMGWAAGQGKPTLLIVTEGEPELMVKLFDHLCTSIEQVKYALSLMAEDFIVKER